MKGFSGFKKDDPPGTENEIMSTMHDMINSGADEREIWSYAKSASDGESNYGFDMKTGAVEVSGPNGRRKLTKENETLGLYKENK